MKRKEKKMCWKFDTRKVLPHWKGTWFVWMDYGIYLILSNLFGAFRWKEGWCVHICSHSMHHKFHFFIYFIISKIPLNPLYFLTYLVQTQVGAWGLTWLPINFGCLWVLSWQISIKRGHWVFNTLPRCTMVRLKRCFVWTYTYCLVGTKK